MVVLFALMLPFTSRSGLGRGVFVHPKGKGRESMRKLAVAVFLLACLLVTSYIKGGGPVLESIPEPEPMEAAGQLVREPAPVSALMAGKTDIIHVTIRDELIEPAQLEADQGEELRLHVVNRSQRTHNLVLAEFGIVGRPLAPGEENYVAFTPSRTGTFVYYGDHSGQVDWRGYLTVR